LREIQKNNYINQKGQESININEIDFNKHESLSKIYIETFVKLFKTKNASCDWSDYFELTQHLKSIVIKQFQNEELPCVDPFQLFMIDFSMQDKLMISVKWAQNEKKKAYDQMKRDGIWNFQPFQH
jgi:hypothetical protein